jgi:hypothetical protein
VQKLPVKNSETLTLFPASPDHFDVHRFLLAFMAAGLALAESHPSWWGLASPDATALVGIRWETLKGSVFADPLSSEFHSSLAFPDLPILSDARQILISSPSTLAIFTGTFPSATLRTQAGSHGLKMAAYKGIDLWISPGKTLSIAQVSEQILLIGARRSLEAAIDRNQAETGTTRRYSPLLARAARFAQSDLWVVSARLPDPLANLFVPLDAESRGFEGGVSLRDGVQLEATLDSGSEDAAAVTAENLRQSIPDLPEVARGLKVVAEADHVLLTLEIPRAQLNASLRIPEEPVKPTELKQVQAVKQTQPEPAPPIPAGPQVIRIFGLDEGPREIVLPPAKPDRP